MTDPIADMLTRIRNGLMAKHDTVEIPTSKIKRAIADILLSEGFINKVEYFDEKPQGSIRITLKYGKGGEKVIRGIKRISKPGLRIYSGYKDIPRILGGMGVVILSTPHGVLSDKEARQHKVGGEVLAYVW
ncbi:MAG: 30S ribosomal protein S8 [Firmicutes bacterium]|nr:30S ribosomal protein S8 [Bacillota bacterium]